jgi:hypothetical protein
LHNFAKTTSAATCACPSRGRAPARAGPGGGSLPRRRPGLLCNFANSTRAPATGAYSPQPAPSRPLAPAGLHHGRCGTPPVPVLRAKRHSALPCPPAPRTMTLRAARAQMHRSPPGAGENRHPSLLPSRRGSARRRRQHLQRRHRPGINRPKELAPLRLGHVLPPRVFPRRPLIGHPGQRIYRPACVCRSAVAPASPVRAARPPPRAAAARSPRSSPHRRSRRSSG